MGCGLSFPKVPLSRDKVVVVTGGNTGIGYENAKWLAMMGAHVIIACRSEERALKFMKLDCASLKSTEDFISEFKAKESRLHLLILNAGISTYGLEYTEDNFESMFHVNYLSQVLLSIKLLPTMMRSGDDCRVIFISSYAHNWGEVDVETIQARQFTTENFDKMKYYGNSKLFQIEVPTLDGHLPRLYWSPYKGSTTQTNAAINPKYKGVRDVYFASCKPKTPNSKARYA
ncbi:hypothetical protein FSP39_002762 [Pinctada imbricata]|uniref:Uncharacterized protein n=1 Tax=Pinctada imbricata TaxID=66713 RepID=A0AA89BZR9_PINIB|nr:hypothetical protein FSP39_002762 [Pinctada imbricata]